MSLRDKILTCLVPFLVAAILWFALASQAFTDWQTKDQAVTEKSQEQSSMRIKLSNLAKVEKERAQLQIDVDNLRNSVPKDPDLDILIIDLEKMCLSSNMDLDDVEKAKAKALASDEAQAKELAAAGGKASIGAKNKAGALGVKPAEETKPGKGGKGSDKDKAKLSPDEEVGLSKEVLQVGVIGSYPNLVELMHKLQSYERVIGISHIDIGLPDQSGSTGTSKTVARPPNERLKVTFFLTAYYLP